MEIRLLNSSFSIVKDFMEHVRHYCYGDMYQNDEPAIEHVIGIYLPKLIRDFSSKLLDDIKSGIEALKPVLQLDVLATYNGDPAANSCEEVLLCYPGVYATTNYRVAHLLDQLEVPVIPRMITELAHSRTGIDIHPSATIGESFMIDHGTGVVIGATSIIGKNVKIYQGVTLGAKSFSLDENGNPVKGIPRHPIVEDDVIIYSNSTILGRVTIGKGAIIGGNLWITGDIPAGEKVVMNPIN